MTTAKLTTLTPVHIGSGEKLLRDFDFIVQDGQVGILDLEKVVEELGINRLPQLTAEIEKKNVAAFLKRALPNTKLEQICDRIATNKAPGSKCNELKEQYHTSLLNACIPGSSVKGAIKTALWETLATKERQSTWSTFDYKNKRGKFDSDLIDKKLFGANPNEKTTRFLKVADVHFPDLATAVFEIGILNAGFDDWRFKGGQSFLAECIPSGATSNFLIKLDNEWLEKNKKHYPEKWKIPSSEFIQGDPTGFCMILNNYISRQLEYELTDLENDGFAEHETGESMLLELERIKKVADKAIREQSKLAIIRIGGNSGWNFTTGGWVKSSPLPNDQYNEMRRMIQRGKTYDIDLWPKTRKLAYSGLPLGFVKIETK